VIEVAMAAHVSVVIPCYKQAQYLPEAVASIVAQHFTNWELIIVDDGSPDDTVTVATTLIAAYPDRAIRLLRQANAGLAGARNAGIAIAQGSIIMPLDADDLIEPEFLARAVAIFDTHPNVGYVYSDVKLFDDEQGLINNRPYDPQRLPIICLSHAASPFRRIAWQQVGGYRVSMSHGYEDWDFWLSLTEVGWVGQHIPIPLVNYRRTGTSMLSTRSQHFDLEIRAMLIRNHPRLYETGFHTWARRVLSPEWSSNDALHPNHWLAAFLNYNLLIALHAPRELPRTLLRPLYWQLPPRLHTPLRRFARMILH
jgi:glycosyltransferase involved in cell wall biosynthesis